jgi:hypothetical protein
MRVLTKLFVALSLIAGVAIVVPVPLGAQPTTWTIRPSASPPSPAEGFLSGIACPTTLQCFAVGGSLLEQWNGTQWSIVKNAIPSGTDLRAVACPSASMCMAVGDDAVVWNGTTWTSVGMPASTTHLVKVACASATRCFAIEYGGTKIFSWNGASWSTATTPALPPLSGFLNLTCGSTTFCVAVGAKYVSGNNLVLAEQWNGGSSWTDMSAPNPTNTNSSFQGVACPTTAMCVAVGNAQSNSTGKVRTLAEHWNGTSWTAVATPTPTSSSVSPDLVGVSCSSTTDCFAISDQRLILRWHAGSWTSVASPTHGTFVDDLADLVCLGASNCLAVGDALMPKAVPAVPAQVAGQRWNGTKWVEQAMPQPTPSKSALLAVSCKVAVCFAVGEYTGTGNKTQPLIERASASGWTKVNAPQASGGSLLTGVSCPTSTACFAVGRTVNGKTLAMAWHNNGWKIMKTANKSGVRNKLTSIACVSATNCWAVGRYDAELLGTLIEHWNGTAWTIVPSPSRKPTPNFELSGENDLQGIACVGAKFCLAVGSDTGNGFTFQETLVEKWNGTTWSLVKSANGGKYSNLASIACTATTSCWAVGDWVNSASATPHHTLIEHWNGSAWKHVGSPNVASGTQNELLSVACHSAKQCVAVGGAAGLPTNGAPSTGKLFAETLSGGTWHLATPAIPATAVVSVLNGVACSNASQCNAVGAFTHPPATQTLAELFS